MGPDRIRLIGAALLVFVAIQVWGNISDAFDRPETDDEFARSSQNDVARAAIDSAFGAPVNAQHAEVDSLALLYARTLQRRDSSRVDSLRIALRAALADRQLSQLRSEIQRKDRELARLRAQSEQNRHVVRSAISGVFDDLGLGFGWFAVYFTGFLTMMRGQTPGKRLMRICVARLDAKPIGWWIAFERFGGYAASFTLGMLGFIQILWDRNRQGLHDKAVETVVISLR